MERIAIPDRPDLLPIIPTPPELERSTVAMQATAPYCGLGFEKSRLPSDLHARLLESMRNNAALFRPEVEIEWLRSTDPRHLTALFHEDPELNREVSRRLQGPHEQWSGMELTESACYGIRIYQRGSYLFNHVDRTSTHIISATICVDHRLERPWPLYIEDIAGTPYQVDMEPGELLFYEGARLRHGRPYPLEGDYYAGMFVHYRPVSLDRL